MECAEELLDRVRALGITLEADGARLRFHPRRYVSGDLLNDLRKHKPELLALLRKNPGTSTASTYTNSLESSQRSEFVDNKVRCSSENCPANELWSTVVEALNAACPPGCILSAEDWARLDEIEILVASAAESGDLVALGAELDAYERTARAIFRKWTAGNSV